MLETTNKENDILLLKNSSLKENIFIKNTLRDYILSDKDEDMMGTLSNLKELAPKFQVDQEKEIQYYLNTFSNALNYDDYEIKKISFDILIYRYILTKLFKNQINIFSFNGILKKASEPNYNILSKIFWDSQKIRYGNILNLLFGKENNEQFKTVLIAEYLIQRKINFKELLLYLLIMRFVLWCEIYEPKTWKWYTELFKHNISISEQFKILDNFDTWLEDN